MTCIVGFRDQSGEIWLGADSRISRWFTDPKGPYVHIDELQKLYAPCQNVAVAFATKSICQVRDVLCQFAERASSFDARTADAHAAYRYSQSVRRSFNRMAAGIDASSRILLAVAFHGTPRWNRLYDYRVCDGRLSCAEVQRGNYVVGGSASGEPGYASFQTEVLDVSFQSPKLDMADRNSLFHDRYVAFHSSLDAEWQSVGQLFASAYTRDGAFVVAESSTVRVVQRGIDLAVQLRWDHDSRALVQHNCLTGQSIPLISIKKYDLSRLPGNENVFRVHGYQGS